MYVVNGFRYGFHQICTWSESWTFLYPQKMCRMFIKCRMFMCRDMMNVGFLQPECLNIIFLVRMFARQYTLNVIATLLLFLYRSFLAIRLRFYFENIFLRITSPLTFVQRFIDSYQILYKFKRFTFIENILTTN